MFEFLHGRVETLGLGVAVLNVGGVGWRLQVTSRTADQLGPGRQARLFTHLAVSETALTLYGFHDESERLLFQQLLQVGGIGPASALGLLSAFDPHSLVGAILDGDTARLTTVKGIGRKTAERLVVELKDRLEGFALASAGGAVPENTQQDLNRVLADLGFRPAEARAAAAAAREELGEDAPMEDLLRLALRHSQNSSS